jgi:hypothetical protein
MAQFYRGQMRNLPAKKLSVKYLLNRKAIKEFMMIYLLSCIYGLGRIM